ncbi:MAG: hypothetical protein ABI120_06395, partial [Gemmatimonadaceae bacterium]
MNQFPRSFARFSRKASSLVVNQQTASNRVVHVGPATGALPITAVNATRSRIFLAAASLGFLMLAACGAESVDGPSAAPA